MPQNLSTCYAALEVDRSATAAEIREAYLDLVKVWHPDRFQDDSVRLQRKAEEKLRTINEAYEIIRSGAPPFQEEPDRPTRATRPSVNPNIRPVNFGGRWGYVDGNGELVIVPRFENAFPFREGLALVAERGRHGFIDATGELAIYPEFALARSFSDGLAAVVLSTHWGFIDSTGRFSVTPLYEECTDFAEGLAGVRWRGRWGYIDDAGRFAIRPRFDGARCFSGGEGEVKLGAKWGKVDRSGRVYFSGAETPLEAGPTAEASR